MNILYIGHYRENNNLGYSSLRYIEALRNISSINLSIRPVYLQNKFLYLPSDNIINLENNYSKYYDIVIQHTLPEFYVYDKRFGKNIGIAKIETENLIRSGWINKINLMDEIWVGSYYSYMSLRDSGIIKKIKVIPEPYNLQLFNSEIKENHNFTFYTITSSEDKDNFKNIILAYLLEFHNDSCKFIIKITKSSDSKNIQKIINNACGIARLDPNKILKPIIFPDHLSNPQMISFHAANSCYIDLQKASSIGSSAIEALITGNSVITMNKSASSSFINNKSGLVINSHREKIYTKPIYNLTNIFTGSEYWYNFNIDEARSAMRMVYNTMVKPQTDISIFDHTKFQQYIS